MPRELGRLVVLQCSVIVSVGRLTFSSELATAANAHRTILIEHDEQRARARVQTHVYRSVLDLMHIESPTIGPQWRSLVPSAERGALGRLSICG